MSNPTQQEEVDAKLDLQKVANYLYVIEDSEINDGQIDPKLFEAISMLRQLINEEFVHKGKSVSSQLIYDTINPILRTLLIEAEVRGYTKGRQSVSLAYSHTPYDLKMYALKDKGDK